MRIRKQDEAPEMGADSSLRLCDGCKNTFQDDFDICPDCSQLAEGTTMSRNNRYEQRKRADGLKKITLWIPCEREAEFKQLAEACSQYRHLSFNTLRDTQSGKYVSLERL